MTARTALIVRGGWDGHQPVQATEVFLPFLEAQGYDVRIEESPEVYADAQAMAATDLIVQCVTMSQITARAGGRAARRRRGGHGPHRLARRHRRLVPRVVGLPPARRRPVRDPPEQAAASCWSRARRRTTTCRYTVEITDLGRQHPITAGIDDFALTHRAVLGAARRPERRAGDHDPPDRSRGIRGTGRSPRPRCGRGCGAPGRIVVTTPGHTSRRPRAPQRPHDHREGDAVGDPHRIGIVGLGVISRAYLDTLADSPAVAITAVADLDAARAAAVAAALPAARALTVAELLASDDVDTVLNLTIPAAHAEIALGAIAHGKDVYGEKPLARHDGRGARDHGCRGPRPACGSGPRRTPCSAPASRRRARSIDAGRIGRPIAATASMVTPGHESWHPSPGLLLPRRAAGRSWTWGRTTSPR